MAKSTKESKKTYKKPTKIAEKSEKSKKLSKITKDLAAKIPKKAKRKNYYKATDNKRIRKATKHRSFRLTKTKLKQAKSLPSIKRTIFLPLKLMWRNKKSYSAIILIHAGLVFVLVSGLGQNFNIDETKRQFLDTTGISSHDLASSFTLFSYLLSNANSASSDTAGIYQLLIGVIIFLATIWLTRRLVAGDKISVKDAFYRGMYPIIPFILLVLLIVVQLLPMVIGNFVLFTVINNGLANTLAEIILWISLFVILSLISIYLIISTIVALNIVTLPDVTPIQALRSSKELVLHRRLGIIARLLVLPLILLALSMVIFVPLIMFVPVIVEPLFLVFSCFWLIYYVVYLYSFYRELL